MNHNIEITDIMIVPVKSGKVKANTKTNVTIVLNDALVLRGLKIIKGEFGHFLAFPPIAEDVPQKLFETCSISLRKHLQYEVLQRYRQVLTEGGFKSERTGARVPSYA